MLQISLKLDTDNLSKSIYGQFPAEMIFNLVFIK